MRLAFTGSGSQREEQRSHYADEEAADGGDGRDVVGHGALRWMAGLIPLAFFIGCAGRLLHGVRLACLLIERLSRLGLPGIRSGVVRSANAVGGVLGISVFFAHGLLHGVCAFLALRRDEPGETV
jgi:hypothetical protein